MEEPLEDGHGQVALVDGRADLVAQVGEGRRLVGQPGFAFVRQSLVNLVILPLVGLPQRLVRTEFLPVDRPAPQAQPGAEDAVFGGQRLPVVIADARGGEAVDDRLQRVHPQQLRNFEFLLQRVPADQAARVTRRRHVDAGADLQALQARRGA